MRRLITAFLLSVTSLVACGGDPVSYSAPVGINLKTKSDDTMNAVVVTEKGITTESGNPYGAFIGEAQRRLAGGNPSAIRLASMTLLLGGSSVGVTALDQVLAGQADVLFIMNDTNNSFAVGSFENPRGVGPINGTITFDSGAFMGDDWTKLLGGGFKVVLRGPAATTFTAKGATADLQATFAFEAFQ